MSLGHRPNRAACWLLLAVAALSCGADAPPVQGANDGITVTASGEAIVMPNHAEISLHSTGTAELAGDAVLKYQQALRRIVQALEKLQIKGLEIKQQGVSLSADPQMAEDEGDGGLVKSNLAVTESLRVTLRDINQLPVEQLVSTLGTILDTARDSGAAVSLDTQEIAANEPLIFHGERMPAVLFVHEFTDEQCREAYRQAMQHATDDARSLAELAGLELGTVRSVTSQVPSERKRKSDSFRGAKFEVTLQVQFAVQPKARP